jgi:LysM repeat protein
MTDSHDLNDDNFVMSDEHPSQENDDDREEYFEAPVSRWDLKSHKPVIFGAIGLVLLSIMVWLFLSVGRQPADNSAAGELESRMTQLEEKLAKLEWLDQGLARLDKQEKNYEALVQRIDRLEAAMKQQSALIDKKIRLLGTRPPAPKSAAKKTAPTAEKSKTANDGIHVVKSGDNLYRISQKYGISLDQLRKLNNLSATSKIFPGQKLKVAP